MSDLMFPDLRGLTWGYKLTPTFSTGVQQSTSGREVRASFWNIPLWKISLKYSYLHQDPTWLGGGDTEFEQLIGFFLARQGSFDSFLIDLGQLTRKPLESNVQGQVLGTGDGGTVNFQLVRKIGPYQEIIQNPAGQQAQVYVGGSPLVQGTDYTIQNGLVTFAVAPALNAVISADFIWLWRVRFVQDSMDFNNFMYLLWECQQLDLMAVRV